MKSKRTPSRITINIVKILLIVATLTISLHHSTLASESCYHPKNVYALVGKKIVFQKQNDRNEYILFITGIAHARTPVLQSMIIYLADANEIIGHKIRNITYFYSDDASMCWRLQYEDYNRQNSLETIPINVTNIIK